MHTLHATVSGELNSCTEHPSFSLRMTSSVRLSPPPLPPGDCGECRSRLAALIARVRNEPRPEENGVKPARSIDIGLLAERTRMCWSVGAVEALLPRRSAVSLAAAAEGRPSADSSEGQQAVRYKLVGGTGNARQSGENEWVGGATRGSKAVLPKMQRVKVGKGTLVDRETQRRNASVSERENRERMREQRSQG